MKRKRVYSWYVRTTHGDTNEMIAGELAKTHAVESCIVRKNIPGEDQPVEVYKLPRSFISMLEKNTIKFGLQFKEYIQEGEGKFREWKFASRGKKKKKTSPIPKPVKESMNSV